MIMGQCQHLVIMSEAKHLPKVRQAVEAIGGLAGFCPKDCHAMALAVDEALANVIKHAYGGARDKTIEIDIQQLNQKDKSSGVEIRIRDYGKTVEPSKIKSRELTDVRPGGLGVHIMKKIMDQVIYECPPDGGTRLRMIKYCGNTSQKQEEHEKTKTGPNERPLEDY